MNNDQESNGWGDLKKSLEDGSLDKARAILAELDAKGVREGREYIRPPKELSDALDELQRGDKEVLATMNAFEEAVKKKKNLARLSAAGWCVFILLFLVSWISGDDSYFYAAVHLVGPLWLLAFAMQSSLTPGQDHTMTITMLVVVFGFITVGNFLSNTENQRSAKAKEGRIAAMCGQDDARFSRSARGFCEEMGRPVY